MSVSPQLSKSSIAIKHNVTWWRHATTTCWFSNCFACQKPAVRITNGNHVTTGWHHMWAPVATCTNRDHLITRSLNWPYVRRQIVNLLFQCCCKIKWLLNKTAVNSCILLNFIWIFISLLTFISYTCIICSVWFCDDLLNTAKSLCVWFIEKKARNILNRCSFL